MTVVTPFGFSSTAGEVLDGVDLRGRRMIVTGANSGIGRATAEALAVAGASVTLAVRDVAAGEQAATEISAAAGGSEVAVGYLDLTDQGSIRSFVETWSGPLHALVNNAGISPKELMRTPEGWELTFATNHLGHFALTVGLRDALADGGGRIVSVSSNTHMRSSIEFEDIHFYRREYLSGYPQSKTANVLFAVAAATKWAALGITANAARPGTVPTPMILRGGIDRAAKAAGGYPGDPGTEWKTVEQGAATLVLAAASPLAERITGKYFEDCNVAAVVDPASGSTRVVPHALDPEGAERLWVESERMLATGKP